MRLFAGTPFDRPPICERCGGIEGECGCPPPPVPPKKQQLRLAVEKRKKGKVVTVARGFSTTVDLPALLTQLKNACGAGGTVKEGTLELQGDHLARMKQILSQIGYRVR